MPSLRGMRRSTRVFGVVKGVDAARVLRSGSRPWLKSEDDKIGRGEDGDDWYKLIGNFGIGLNSKANNKWHEVGSNKKIEQFKTDIKPAKPKSRRSVPNRHIAMNYEGNGVERFGAVYIRKRKRLEFEISVSDRCNDYKRRRDDNSMFALHFVRRKKRGMRNGESLVLVVDVFSFNNARCFGILLHSVLRYMTREMIKLRQLSTFLLSESISCTFSSVGIDFLKDLPSSTNSSGICKLFGAVQFTPFFNVNFSALPVCFMFMHSTMLLRSELFAIVLAYTDNQTNESDSDGEEDLSCRTINGALLDSNFEASVNNTSLFSEMLHSQPTSQVSKLDRCNAMCRNGLNSQSVRVKRKSLRSRRARKNSTAVNKSYRGSLGPDLVNIKNDLIPFSSSVLSCNTQRTDRSNVVGNIKKLKSPVVDVKDDWDSTCCSANILVIESDRCYREEGVTILLEHSCFNQWFLVVKRDGLTRYSLKAENVMRPCASNRITNAVIWTVEGGWKLEFPNRPDWFIFKELYKECSRRHLADAVEKVIPIPGVVKVSGFEYGCGEPFIRPELYISLDGDEVSRALAKRTSNYDMDSEDEEWLSMLNNGAFTEELYENVSNENFELMFDAFEKSFFCNPDNYSEEKVATSLCQDMVREEVTQTVYSYWTNKRKRKQSALVKAFQGHQRRKSHLSESVLRKKRSFKRQASQIGRGNQRLFFQVMDTEQSSLVEKNARLRMDEAKVAANKAAEIAIAKRKRSQILMEIADSAAYKAAIAYRIAEAAHNFKTTDVAVVNFLD